MEMIDMLRVLRRWLLFIVAVVLAVELALWLGMSFAGPRYSTTVRLQISTPQREDVAAFDDYRAVSLRDEITVARNNLSELLQNNEVFERTTAQLGLKGKNSRYSVDVEPVRDADFLDITVRARTPSLAAEIANAHVQMAIGYYGELRAKSTSAEKDFFAQQLQSAEETFRKAEAEFAAFQAQHGIAPLERELATYQELLEQLRLERDQLLLARLTRGSTDDVDKLIAQRQAEVKRLLNLAPTYNLLEAAVESARGLFLEASRTNTRVSAARAALLAAEQAFVKFQTENDIFSFDSQMETEQKLLEQLQAERDQRLLADTTTVDPADEIDKLIFQRQTEMDRLTSLAPEYNVLNQSLEQARDTYQHLLAKYQEAVLKVTVVQAANFVQVVKPAYVSGSAASDWPKLAVLALAGGLGLGIVLAFLLDYLVGAGRHAAVSQAPGTRPGYASVPDPTPSPSALATEQHNPAKTRPGAASGTKKV
jgi:uncharacterized protein involved in exopolysaccharide biosynthesis